MNVLTASGTQELPKTECSPVKLEEPTSPSTTTPVPMTPEVLRGILPQPLFGQFPYPNAAMAQILAAQAAQAHAAQHIAFPAVPVFPAGIPDEFKPSMMMGGGPAPMPLFLGDNSHLFHPYALDGMKKRNATREATAPLKEWLHAHRKNPYPSKGDKLLLAMQTRMSLTQVSTWFANARRRLKKENKMTWSPQNRRGDGCDEDEEDDDDDMNRPSSSTSIVSDRKEGLLGKPHLASPTPSGGSSEDLVTPKKMHEGSPVEEDSPKRKPKMWSIADVTSDDDSTSKKDSPPSSDENLLNGNLLFQSAIKKQLEMMSRMNPFMLQFFAQQAAQAQQLPLLVPQPNEAGLMSQSEETTTPSPASSSPR